MKQFLRHIFLLVAMLVATASAWAQKPVYKEVNGVGTWYSLYDTNTKTNVNASSKNFGEISGVFAPAESMTFQYKKYSFLSTKGEVRVYNKKSDGNWEHKGGVNYSDYNDWNKTHEIPLDANISAIRYRMESGTGVDVKDHFIKLKKHILLADGIYGTTSKSIPFENVVIGGTSNAQEVKLRSFLTTGNITIKSSNNAFRIKTSTNTNGDVYAVGANACACSGGSGNAGGNNLGNIDNYTVTIYFCPSEAKYYEATISLTDGTSTATIIVSGTGIKKNQSIVWSDKFAADKPSIPVGKEVSDAATVTSGLTPIIYSSSDENIIAITNDGKGFKALAPGTATIIASQTGDSKWNSTSSLKTITVTEKKIQYIKWTDNLTRFKTGDAPFTMTATAHILVNVETEETQEVPERTTLIKYTSANSNIVSVNDKVLTIVGAGETYVTATLEGDDTYEKAEITMPVRVRNITDGCERFVLDAPDEVKYSAPGGGSYTPTSWTAPAGKLTFEARIGNGTAVGDIEVQQLVNGSWKDIDNFMPPTSWTEYGPYDLDRNATQVRFYSNGSFNRFIKNVLVTQATYVEPFVNGVKLAENETFVLPETAVGVQSENTFELNWSTCDDEGIFLEVDKPTKFKVQPTSISAQSVHYSKTPITVTCIDPSVANTDVIANIVITYDGNKTYTQPVKCLVKDKLETWLEYHGKDTYSESDGLVANPFTLHDNDGVVAGAKIKLTSSNSEILSIVEVDGEVCLQAHCGGSVVIMAEFEGSNKHKPCTLKHTIDVPYCQQEIIWDQNLMYFETQEDGSIDKTCKLTAYVTPTYAPISYELVNADFAEIIGSEGNYSLHVFRSGTGTLIAHAPEYTYQGRIYAAQQYMQEIRVHVPGECQSYALQIREEQNSHGWGQIYKIYDIQGLPENTMTFGAHVNTASTNNILYVDFSKDGTNWEPAERNRFTIGESYKWDYQCPVPDSVKYVRFEAMSSLATFFNMVSIRQKSYLTPSISAINMPDVVVNQPFEYTFTVDYSDIPVLKYEVTNLHNLNLTLTPDKAVTNYCGTYGTYTFTLKGNSPYPQENITEKIILSTSAGHNIEIPITITASLLDTYYCNNNGNWHDLSSWTVSGVTPTVLPSSSNLVIVSKQVTIEDHAAAYGVEVQDGGYINISSSGGLTVYAGGYTTSSQEPDLEITIDNEHTGYFRMSPKATTAMPKAKVNFKTRGNMNAGGDKDATWQYIGAPGEDVATDLLGTTVLYLRSEEKGWVRLKTFRAELEEFAGYALTQKTQPDYTFYPQLINDNKTIQLTYTSSANGGMEGDNLWANSYMAPLDITKLDLEKDFTGNVEKTFYLYNSGSWNAWNEGMQEGTSVNGGDTPGRYYAINKANVDPTKDQVVIPPMQAVYMKAQEGGGSITLNYEKHVWNNDQIGQMNRPLRVAPHTDKTQLLDILRIRLQVNSENSGADRMYIIQDSVATSDYDNGYDAPKLMADGLINIYTNEPCGKMEISSTDHMDGMYIGFQAGEDDVYTMTFTSLIGEDLYLYDVEQDTLVAMSEGEPYQFAAVAKSTNDMRFQILVNPDLNDYLPNGGNGDGVTTDIYDVQAQQLWVQDEKVYIAHASANSILEVYTASGMPVARYAIGYAPCTLDLSGMPTGVYMLRLNDKVYKFICK